MKRVNRNVSDSSDAPKYNMHKRVLCLTLIFAILLASLQARIGWLQFVQGASLKESAVKQQTVNRILSSNRGTIYDSTGKPLAVSEHVDTITINPSQFIDEDSEDNTAILQKKVAFALSDIFGLDYNEVYKKVTSSNLVETIVKKVEEDKVNALKKWMSDNDVSARY